ncbi:MAG: hypothetical protein AABZ14_07960, partial [Candidatus Margulisiibacteriota bacterium]
MELFFVSEDIEFPTRSGKIKLIAPTKEEIEGTIIPYRNIYITTTNCTLQGMSNLFKSVGKQDILKCFSQKGKQVLLQDPRCPMPLGYIKGQGDFIPLEEKIKPLLGADTIRIAIVNGMSTSLGDSVVGLRALSNFHEIFSQNFEEIIIDVFQFEPVTTIKLYDKDPIIRKVFQLPLPVDRFFGYNAYIDFSGFIVREEFNNQPMIDFYLEALSIPRNSIPPEGKRNHIYLNPIVAKMLEKPISLLR